MADPITPFDIRLLALHDALIGGDTTALAQIWVELHGPLCRRLRRRFRTAPTDVIDETATDAVLAYGTNPLTFDRTRGVPLEMFVYGIGVRLLRDRLRKDGRTKVRETDFATRQVAYQSATVDRATERVLAREVRTLLRAVCDEMQRDAIDACLDRDDDDAVAASLGVSALPEADQRHAKKRLWDAAVKRLRRLLSQGGRQKAKAWQ